MTTYSFETITAAQALAFAQSDRLFFSTGTATQVSVAFLGNGHVTITLGAQTVEFGINLTLVGLPLSFPDHSSLFIGANTPDLVTFGAAGFPSAAFGGQGDDSLDMGPLGGLAQGNQGADTLTSAGRATIYGGQDNDKITFGAAGNFAQGNKGDDIIQGGSGDTLLGGQGADTISGGGFLNGNLGNDSLSGSGQLFGEGGNDTLIGAGSGHSSIDGGDGDDSLAAGLGGDSISGGDGNDTIDGSGGANVIAGGAGDDVFRFTSHTSFLPTLSQTPRIVDWSPQDRLSLHGLGPTAVFGGQSAADFDAAVAIARTILGNGGTSYLPVQVGPDLFVFSTAGGSSVDVVELVGRTLADITGHNFI